jgi:hypothetical protein
MAANPPITFHATLEWLGFNQATCAAINKNGFNEILHLLTVQEEDLDRLPTHLEAWRDPDADPNNMVHIPFISLKRLKVMCYWVQTQQYQGVAPLAQGFTNKVLVKALKWMKADTDLKLATEDTTEDTEVHKPPKLMELSKWTKWWELFTTYLGQIWGAAMVLLTYLVREQAIVTDEIRGADYASTEDDERIAIMAEVLLWCCSPTLCENKPR